MHPCSKLVDLFICLHILKNGQFEDHSVGFPHGLNHAHIFVGQFHHQSEGGVSLQGHLFIINLMLIDYLQSTVFAGPQLCDQSILQ